jgi:hypothetical protein
MPLPRTLVVCVAALMGASLLGCPRRTALWILGQEAPGRPVFGVGETVHGEPTYLNYFFVAPCEGWDGTSRTKIWSVAQGSPSMNLSRLTYGRAPDGYFVTGRGGIAVANPEVAPPLATGCYVASTDGRGQLRFHVGPDGSVLEAPR